MEIRDKINEFLSTVPEVKSAIGYGSGVKKQDDGFSKKAIDIIATVDDDYSWHKENLKRNPDLYSKFAKGTDLSFLHWKTDVNFLANIVIDGQAFKIGTINEKKLLENIEYWDHFYIPGRLQKSILEVKATDKLHKAIRANRKNALTAALLTNYDQNMSFDDLLYNICNLSYSTDIRMKLGMENKNKVQNIVKGSYDELKEIYTDVNEDLYTIKNGKVLLNFYGLLDSIDEYFPAFVASSLADRDIYPKDLTVKDLKLIKKLILKRIGYTTKSESVVQPSKGVLLNPVSKSIEYGFQKRLKYKGNTENKG